jgi:hypothetical protein
MTILPDKLQLDTITESGSNSRHNICGSQTNRQTENRSLNRGFKNLRYSSKGNVKLMSSN